MVPNSKINKMEMHLNIGWTDGVKAIKMPWARDRSDFTLLMDGLILEFARHMAIKIIADEIGETDIRIWRVIEFYVYGNLNMQLIST